MMMQCESKTTRGAILCLLVGVCLLQTVEAELWRFKREPVPHFVNQEGTKAILAYDLPWKYEKGSSKAGSRTCDSYRVPPKSQKSVEQKEKGTSFVVQALKENPFPGQELPTKLQDQATKKIPEFTIIEGSIIQQKTVEHQQSHDATSMDVEAEDVAPDSPVQVSPEEARTLGNTSKSGIITHSEIPFPAQYKLGDYIKDSKRKKQRYGRIVKITLELTNDLSGYKKQEYKIQYQGGIGDNKGETITNTDTVTAEKLKNTRCDAYYKTERGKTDWKKDAKGKQETRIRYTVHETEEQASSTPYDAQHANRRRLLPLTGHPRRQF
jgi:hypothetical protein